MDSKRATRAYRSLEDERFLIPGPRIRALPDDILHILLSAPIPLRITRPYRRHLLDQHPIQPQFGVQATGHLPELLGRGVTLAGQVDVIGLTRLTGYPCGRLATNVSQVIDGEFLTVDGDKEVEFTAVRGDPGGHW